VKNNYQDSIEKSAKELLDIKYFETQHSLLDSLEKGIVLAINPKNGIRLIPINLLNEGFDKFNRQNFYSILLSELDVDTEYYIKFTHSFPTDTFIKIDPAFHDFDNIQCHLSTSFSYFQSYRLLNIELPHVFYNYDLLFKNELFENFNVVINISLFKHNNNDISKKPLLSNELSKNSYENSVLVNKYSFLFVLKRFVNNNNFWNIENKNEYKKLHFFDPFDVNIESLTFNDEKILYFTDEIVTNKVKSKNIFRIINLPTDCIFFILNFITNFEYKDLEKLIIYKTNTDEKNKRKNYNWTR
jgi:hypothetical protein